MKATANRIRVRPRHAVANASASGAAYVKAFCDLDGDGECDANADIVLVKRIPQGAVANVSFVFGDVDGDRVSDAQERAEGTDPYDSGNYAFSMFAHFTGVFHTTNFLLCGDTPFSFLKHIPAVHLDRGACQFSTRRRLKSRLIACVLIVGLQICLNYRSSTSPNGGRNANKA